MRYFYYFFIFILLVGVVDAIDYNVVTITDCASPVRIIVNGTLPIDPGEYMFLGCTDNTTFWECPCNNTPIILNVQKNTINNYTLGLSYTAKYTVSEKKRGGGGSGGYSYEYYINTTVSNIANTSTNISNTSATPPIPPPTPTPTPTSPPPPNTIYAPTQSSTPANNTQISDVKQPNIFQKIWAWLIKILFYEIW